jgi:hypothetical protein
MPGKIAESDVGFLRVEHVSEPLYRTLQDICAMAVEGIPEDGRHDEQEQNKITEGKSIEIRTLRFPYHGSVLFTR